MNERQYDNSAKRYRPNNNRENGEYSVAERKGIKRKLEIQKNTVLNITNIERKKNENVLLVEFLVDTGATEHLTNSRLTFKTFDKQAKEIKCANKNEYANLRSEGEGQVQGYSEIDKLINQEKVICAENLSDNLLSQPKFADKGLSINLDNKIIDIYDPASNESFISGIYKRPYWIIQLKVNNENSVRDQLNGKMVAYVTTRRMKNQINTETVEENEKDNES